MTISHRTRKLLWARSGNLCVFCGQALTASNTASDRDALMGDECHIVARKPNGPRFDPAFPQKEIDDYENLILLCKTHHKLIDDQPSQFDAARLRKMKEEHDRSIRRKLASADLVAATRDITIHVDKDGQLPEFNETMVRYMKTLQKENGQLVIRFDINREALVRQVPLPISIFQAMTGTRAIRQAVDRIRSKGATTKAARDFYVWYSEVETELKSLDNDLRTGLLAFLEKPAVTSWVVSDRDVVLAVRGYVQQFFGRESPHQFIIELWFKGDPSRWKIYIRLDKTNALQFHKRTNGWRYGEYLDFTHDQLMHLVIPRIMYRAIRLRCVFDPDPVPDYLFDLKQWKWCIRDTDPEWKLLTNGPS